MSFVPIAVGAVERLPLPDALTRAGIGALVSRTRRKLVVPDVAAERAFAQAMDGFPVAAHTDAANTQHYEVPAAFFDLCLGPRRKYSCCWYDTPTTTLAEAEERALALTCAHADLADGQRILELGCGWGSLTLWMAEHYPAARITAVSNSASQRAFILGEAARRGLGNVDIVTADMNAFATAQTYDRIVSVEMFEHMSNWRALLARTRGWLADGGRLFIHVFAHAHAPYRFDHADKSDWIAQHFFTGGIMPSRGLMRQFPDLYAVEDAWDWNGTHYARTARDWLARCDANTPEILRLFAQVYGADARLWLRRWRLFYLATEGLFGHANGEAWGSRTTGCGRPEVALLATIRARTAAYLANADPLALAANTGALLVWGSQPTYPLYVFALVGRHAWPALLTWLSTPLFFAVPLLARRNSRAGRALFCGAGLANTLVSTKAFGTGTSVGWFLVPCLVIAVGFFRAAEWRWAAALIVATLAAALAVPHLAPPLVAYTAAEQTSLAHLNLWSVLVLTLYLVYGAWRAGGPAAAPA